MNKILFLTFFNLLLISNVFSQNLLEEKIWKISDRKKSMYQERGVFHNGKDGAAGVLTSIRHSYNKSIGAERIVFDFSGPVVPRTYGHLAKSSDKVFVDFFQTTYQGTDLVTDGFYLRSVETFKISKDIFSIELTFKNKVSMDVFYLENPGRLVLDIKNK